MTGALDYHSVYFHKLNHFDHADNSEHFYCFNWACALDYNYSIAITL